MTQLAEAIFAISSMLPNILTDTQIRVLCTIGSAQQIRERFYLTGGTALAGYYLGHRYSEDLDFFSFDEVDPMSIEVFLKSSKTELGFESFQYQQGMNRNLYFLKYGKEELKMEFTYFPFTRIEKFTKDGGLNIDSILDIAVNKLFTIYQRSVARDYIDLYLLCVKQSYTIQDLMMKARAKFDWHIDPLQLGTQFYKANEVLDIPRMIIDLKPELWREFFKSESEKLKGYIFDKM